MRYSEERGSLSAVLPVAQALQQPRGCGEDVEEDGGS